MLLLLFFLLLLLLLVARYVLLVACSTHHALRCRYPRRKKSYVVVGWSQAVVRQHDGRAPVVGSSSGNVLVLVPLLDLDVGVGG